jgi:hypothetical protein
MSEWIDIDACVKLSGKSVATIRRAIKRLPADSIKKEGTKHLYDRALILAALGVDTVNDRGLVVANDDTVMPESTIEHDTVNDRADDTPLIEALRAQITMQGEQLKEKQAVIDSLLERQRETNILLGQLRLLTTTKPDVTGKSEAEIRRDTVFMYVALAIVLVILGLIVWASWR